MLEVMLVALSAVPVAMLLVGPRRLVFSPPMMYFIGTAMFLYPGAFLQVAVLWTVKRDTAVFAAALIVLSVAAAVVGYGAICALFRPRVTNELRILEISTQTLFVLLGTSIAIKLFLDPHTLVGLFKSQPGKLETVAERYLSILVAIPTALGCLAPWLWRHRARKSFASSGTISALVLVGIFGLSRTPIFYILGSILLSLLWDMPSLWRRSLFRLTGIAVAVLVFPSLTYFAAIVKGTNRLLEHSGEGSIDVTAVVDYARASQYDLATSDAYGNLLYI